MIVALSLFLLTLFHAIINQANIYSFRFRILDSKHRCKHQSSMACVYTRVFNQIISLVKLKEVDYRWRLFFQGSAFFFSFFWFIRDKIEATQHGNVCFLISRIRTKDYGSLFQKPALMIEVGMCHLESINVVIWPGVLKEGLYQQLNKQG